MTIFMGYNYHLERLKNNGLGVYDSWSGVLDCARNAPSGLFRHMEEMKDSAWGSDFPGPSRNYNSYVFNSIANLAFVERINGKVELPEDLLLREMDARELVQLYDIVNHHIEHGGGNLPENGAIAREILALLKKEIIKLAKDSPVLKEQILREIENSPKSNLNAFKTGILTESKYGFFGNNDLEELKKYIEEIKDHPEKDLIISEIFEYSLVLENLQVASYLIDNNLIDRNQAESLLHNAPNFGLSKFALKLEYLIQSPKLTEEEFLYEKFKLIEGEFSPQARDKLNQFLANIDVVKLLHSENIYLKLNKLVIVLMILLDTKNPNELMEIIKNLKEHPNQAVLCQLFFGFICGSQPHFFDKHAFVLHFLIESKLFDPNQPIAAFGDTLPLVLAISSKRSSSLVIKLLLKNGANPNLANPRGGHSLLISCFDYANFEAMELLLKNGANPSVKNLEGEWLFHLLLKNLDKVSNNKIWDFFFASETFDFMVKDKEGKDFIDFYSQRVFSEQETNNSLLTSYLPIILSHPTHSEEDALFLHFCAAYLEGSEGLSRFFDKVDSIKLINCERCIRNDNIEKIFNCIVENLLSTENNEEIKLFLLKLKNHPHKDRFISLMLNSSLEKKNYEIVSFLLTSNFIDLSKVVPYEGKEVSLSFKLLKSALDRKNIEEIKLFIEHGASIYTTNSEGISFFDLTREAIAPRANSFEAFWLELESLINRIRRKETKQPIKTDQEIIDNARWSETISKEISNM